MKTVANDNPETGEGVIFTASAPAFLLPTAGAAVLLALLASLALIASGTGSTAARVFLAGLAIGVPALAIHGVLLAWHGRVRVFPHAVFVRSGYPGVAEREIGLADVVSSRLATGVPGRLTGAGTLVIGLRDGREVAARGLRQAGGARRALEAARTRFAQRGAVPGDALPDLADAAEMRRHA